MRGRRPPLDSPGALRLLPGGGHARAQVVGERDDRGPGDEGVVTGEARPSGRDDQEGNVTGKRRLIDATLTHEGNACTQEHKVQKAGAVAQVTVGEDLREVAGR